MSTNHVKPDGGRQTLLAVLQQAHFRVAMIAVLLAGLSVFVVGLATLRVYMIDNLGLSARAIAYTVEAALVFDDRDAAGESLSLMAADNPIAAAQVLDLAGNEFAGWKKSATAPYAALEDALARLMLTEPAEAAVVHDSVRIGLVKIYGSGRDLLKYLVISLVCALLGLALSAVAAYRLSHLASQTIVEPLQRLAGTVSAARRERLFNRRVAPANVVELQDLGDDVNALLEELERWQAQVESESASLEHLANHDPLTGLANRTRFESRLNTDILPLLRFSERGAGFPGLAVVDATLAAAVPRELWIENVSYLVNDSNGQFFFTLSFINTDDRLLLLISHDGELLGRHFLTDNTISDRSQVLWSFFNNPAVLGDTGSTYPAVDGDTYISEEEAVQAAVAEAKSQGPQLASDQPLFVQKSVYYTSGQEYHDQSIPCWYVSLTCREEPGQGTCLLWLAINAKTGESLIMGRDARPSISPN